MSKSKRESNEDVLPGDCQRCTSHNCSIRKNKENIRPSSSVLQRVKRISAEFSLTHAKYTNAIKPKTDPLVSAGGKGACVQYPLPQPKTGSQRYTAETSPRVHVTGCAKGIQYSQVRRAQNQYIRPATCPQTRYQRLTHVPYFRPQFTERKDTYRTFVRKRNNGHFPSLDYPKVPRLPYSQVKKAKAFVEKAVREGRVFTIYGHFPAIKEALIKRGWVEKVLPFVPYVNPHPNNCVCPHVGWHTTPSPQKSPSQTTSKSQDSSDLSNDGGKKLVKVQQGSPHVKPQKDKYTEEESSGISKDINVSEEQWSSEDTQFGVLSLETGSVNTDSEFDSAIGSKRAEVVESESEETQLDHSSKDDESSSVDECEGRLPDAKSLVTDGDDCPSINLSDPHVHMCSQKSFICSSECLPLTSRGLSKTINTAILGPSEVREGLEKTINSKNISIFRYSHPPYDPSVHRQVRPRTPVKKEPIQDNDEAEKKDQANEAEKVIEWEDSSSSDSEKKSEPDHFEAKPVQPPNPYPVLEYHLTELDKPLVARVLRNVEPNFLWTWAKESISFKHLSKDQIVNKFPNAPFTTKYGLCETLQQLHWFSEASSVDTFVPRAYCIGLEDERSAFIQDYRTTACIGLVKHVVDSASSSRNISMIHPWGEVPIRRVRQALHHMERFIQTCEHNDLDARLPPSLLEKDWDAVVSAHHRVVYEGKRIKAPVHNAELRMDGLRNVWIVKPGAQSRGRGIVLLNSLNEILSLVQSPLIYQTKYVVQKYIERPLLIHNTKFDIRQWFLVTDWNPLTVWVYRESYLRFCSQEFDLTNNNEAIHLSNNAIQCKYVGTSNGRLPEEHMWDCHQFKDFLRSQGHEMAWDTIIYPGMKNALVATMLAAQVELDTFKPGFELFGADFMLTEDLRPWLIEINSSPCMSPTTSITKRMCAECLRDSIKVVIDWKQNKNAETGHFELVYKDAEKINANTSYLGVNLQVVGRQLWKNPPKFERRAKKRNVIPRVVNPLPVITLTLESLNDQPSNSANNCANINWLISKKPALITLVSSGEEEGSDVKPG